METKSKKEKMAAKGGGIIKPVIHEPMDLSEQPAVKEAAKNIANDIIEMVPAVGRPRKEATVRDMIMKLKEAKLAGEQVIKQKPRLKYRIRRVNKVIDHWCKIVLNRIDDDPAED